MVLNRLASREWKRGAVSEDVDYGALNDALAAAYLASLPEICEAFPSDEAAYVKGGIEAMARPRDRGYLACRLGGELRVFRTDDDEDEARGKLGIKPGAPVVTFGLDPRAMRITFRNTMPSFLVKSDKDMLDGLLSKVAGSLGTRPSSLVVSFDPGLSRPFVARTGSYRALADLADREVPDMPVVEAPCEVGGEAALVRSAEEEDGRAARLRRLRIISGMDVPYPFLAVDNRVESRGRRLRAMLRELGMAPKDVPPGDGREFLVAIGDPDARRKVKRAMACLAAAGLDRKQVLDFFAGPSELLRRAEFRKVMDEDPKLVLASKAREADLGPGLGINDWWKIGLQEGLDRSQHTDGKPPAGLKHKKDPYNLRRAKEPETYEALLKGKRSEEPTGQKLMEQQLRESQI